MGEHFQAVEPVDIARIGWRGLDLYFKRVPDPPPTSPTVESLRRAYEDAVQKLHFAAQTEEHFMAVFNEILASSESALGAPGGSIEDGNDSLVHIRQKILALAAGAAATTSSGSYPLV